MITSLAWGPTSSSPTSVSKQQQQFSTVDYIEPATNPDDVIIVPAASGGATRLQYI
jgi:hypothetical protein